MEVSVLPSQFLSVVLEETKRVNRSSLKENVPTAISDSVTITPVLPQSPIGGRRIYSISTNNERHRKSPKESYVSSQERELLEIMKGLPQIVLEECIIEAVNPNSQKIREQELRIQDDCPVLIIPINKRNKRKIAIQRNTEDVEELDIMPQVEAVYSDDENELEDAPKDLTKKVSWSPSKNTNGRPKMNGGALVSTATLEGTSSAGNSSSNNYLPYACDHCPNKYSNRGALWQHSVASHSVEKTCECQLCGRKFYRNCSLALHMKCHSDEQNCSCKLCGKEFSRLSLLEKHTKTHAESFHTCKICAKTFAYEESLQKHLLTHQHEKYSCELCNVTFGRKQLLDLHFEMTHNRNETPFICKLCKARFGNLRDLTEHSMSHTSEKLQISCHYCNETFTQRMAYKKHLQMHMGDRLRCEICQIDFTQRSSLLRHLKRLHGINGIPLPVPVISNGSGVNDIIRKSKYVISKHKLNNNNNRNLRNMNNTAATGSKKTIYNKIRNMFPHNEITVTSDTAILIGK